MNARTDPDFENDSINCLKKRLTMPVGKKVPDPFQMKNLSNDLSQLHPFGLLDIFNHLKMSKNEYDKEMLSSWRSFDEYSLCLDGHARHLEVEVVKDSDGVKYSVVVARVLPTQKGKAPEGKKHYGLWFMLCPNGAVYSAFCQCKGGADQGCMFELDAFLSSVRDSVTSVPAYWQPKESPLHKPVPIMEIKISHLT